MDKILFVDKPAGITSFDVIRRLRKKLGVKKMGHAGTLDPFATGLMIIGVGDSTKRLTGYIKLPKTYNVEIILGVKTDTGDITGKVIEEKQVGEINGEAIKDTLEKMVGTLNLAVPMYSAVKIGGKKLYEYAREKNISVSPPVREMIVYSAEFKGVENQGKNPIVCASFDVSSGTYVRALAEEFGHRLGLPATVKNLRRTKINGFKVENAIPLN